MSESTMKEITTEEMAATISDAQYRLAGRVTAAVALLTSDVDGGIRALTTIRSTMQQKEPERVEMVAEQIISFLLGITDEVRYFVVQRMRELVPQIMEPDKDVLNARVDYERRVASLPKNISDLLAENAARDLLANILCKAGKDAQQ